MARLLDGAAPTLLATDPPYGVQLDQTWRDGVYNGPRKRVKGWGVVAGAAKPYMMREAPMASPTATTPHAAKRGAHGRHHGPPQHLDQRRHPGRLVRGVRPRALPPGRLRLVRERPHPRGAVRACSASASSSPSRSSGTRASSRSAAPGTTGTTSPASSCASPACRTCSSASTTSRRSGERPAPSGSGAGSKETKEDHPTQKPVLLSEIPIRNHLRPGEAVYEPFSGSGTTLMAAETARPALLRDGDRPQVRPGRDRALAELHGPDGGAGRWLGRPGFPRCSRRYRSISRGVTT